MKPIHSILLLLLSFQSQSAQLQQETDRDQVLLKLEQHRQLWNGNNVHNYSFVMDKSWWYFPARVTVTRDEVVAVLDTATGEPKRARTPEGREREGSVEPPPRSLDMYLTAEGLFDLVEDAIDVADREKVDACRRFHHRLNSPLRKECT